METIYKYELPIEKKFDLILHEDYKIIHYALKAEKPHIWVYQDTDEDEIDITFYCYGTEVDLDNCPVNSSCHIGTFLLDNGALVLHYFTML